MPPSLILRCSGWQYAMPGVDNKTSLELKITGLRYDSTLKVIKMKANIHPDYTEIKVTCSCGHSFTTRSTLEQESLSIEVCSKCHPFFTGKQKLVDTAGRIDKFQQKYGLK